jgi:hypothetical protein
MQKAGAKLMFLSTLFLFASAACMRADAGVSSRAVVQASGPSQPPQPLPKPSGPAPDGGAPFPQPCAPNCGSTFAPR